MLCDLHHVMSIILRDLDLMIQVTFSMLCVLCHVQLRDTHHMIYITFVTTTT